MKTSVAFLIVGIFLFVSNLAGAQESLGKNEAAKSTKPMKSKPVTEETKLELAPISANLVLKIKLKNEKSADQNYFQRIGDCSTPGLDGITFEETGKCFEFHTAFKNMSVMKAPIVVVNTLETKAFGGIKATLQKKQDTDWGLLYFYEGTEKGLVRYIFLAPKGGDKMIRVGPFSSAVYNLYELQWSIESW